MLSTYFHVVLLAVVTCPSAVETLDQRFPRLFGVGDLHGDIHNTLRAFKLTRCVDDDGNWIGHDSTIVQLGDVVDRGPDSRKILDFLARLKQQASKAGGAVIQILGNHELMAFKGRTKYVHKGDLASFGSPKERKAAFAPGGAYGYMRDYDTVVIRNRTLFVHAGLTPKLANMSFQKLNEGVRFRISKNHWNNVLLADNGPQWTRTVIRACEKGDCQPLEDVLATLRKTNPETPIDRIVVGHTIQYGKRVRQFCNNRFVATDLAMSTYMKLGANNLGAIEILPVPDPDNPNSQTIIKILSHNETAAPFVIQEPLQASTRTEPKQADTILPKKQKHETKNTTLEEHMKLAKVVELQHSEQTKTTTPDEEHNHKPEKHQEQDELVIDWARLQEEQTLQTDKIETHTTGLRHSAAAMSLLGLFVLAAIMLILWRTRRTHKRSYGTFG